MKHSTKTPSKQQNSSSCGQSKLLKSLQCLWLAELSSWGQEGAVGDQTLISEVLVKGFPWEFDTALNLMLVFKLGLV